MTGAELQVFSTNEFVYSGNIALLRGDKDKIVLYSSRDIPGQYREEYIRFYKTIFAQELVLAGGWHSPFEKELLKWWKKYRPCPVIYLASRSLPLSGPYFEKLFRDIQPDHYLILDPHLNGSRISRSTVLKRDQLAFSFFDNFLFTHIQPGGHCEQLLASAEGAGKNIFLYNHISNEIYINDPVTLVDPFSLDILRCL